MGIGAAIWWALSGIAAAFVGGWGAAHLSGVPSREAGMLHGIATWAAATLVPADEVKAPPAIGLAAGGAHRRGRRACGGFHGVGAALPGDAGPAAQQARAAADAAAEGASTAALS